MTLIGETADTAEATAGGETGAKQAETSAKKRRRKRMWIAAIVIVMHVLGFLSSIHAIMSTRTEQGAIAVFVTIGKTASIRIPREKARSS